MAIQTTVDDGRKTSVVKYSRPVIKEKRPTPAYDAGRLNRSATEGHAEIGLGKGPKGPNPLGIEGNDAVAAPGIQGVSAYAPGGGLTPNITKTRAPADWSSLVHRAPVPIGNTGNSGAPGLPGASAPVSAPSPMPAQAKGLPVATSVDPFADYAKKQAVATKEKAFQSAINSPTAQANRLKATGNAAPIAAQKAAGLPVRSAAETQSALNKIQTQDIPAMNAKKFADGLALQTKINQSNAASLGAMPGALGSVGTMKSTLPPRQAATGLQMGTMGSTIQPPQPATGVPMGGAQPSSMPSAAVKPVAPGLPSNDPSFVRPTNAANPGPGNGLLPAPAVQPDNSGTQGLPTAKPDEALNQFASQELGGVEWQDKVNGAKRGRRAVGGAYNGMTEAQALNAVQEKFRRLSLQQKQAMYDRKAVLETKELLGLLPSTY